MDWWDFSALPWWGVVLAFLAAFAFGWLWYSQIAFLPVWARLGSLDEEKLRNANMGAVFGQMMLGNALGVIALAALMLALGVTSVVGGALLGAFVGVAFRAGAHLVHNGFAQRHWGITVIDSVHDTLALAIAGAVLGIFA